MILNEKMNGSLKTSFDRISPENNVVHQSNDTRSGTKNTNNNVIHKNKTISTHSDSKQHHIKQSISSHSENVHKKNFILVSDPFLTKCEHKVYRYANSEHPVTLKDPRNRIHSLPKYPLEMPVPRFKIDENYTGIPPAIEVSIMNLNDNIRIEFLRENILNKFGTIEKVEILHHPLTKQHLGLAKVTYFKSSSASLCVSKLNGASVMGNVLSVFHDPFAKHINEAYHEIVNPTQNFNVPAVSDHENDADIVKKDTIDSSESFTKVINGYKSPERECLERRISHMIRDPKITSQSALFGSIKCLRDSMNDDLEDILKIPPSPFISDSHYLKWNRITQEIEKGSDPLLIERLIQESSDRDDHNYDDMDMSCSSNEEDNNESFNYSSSQHYRDSYQRDISSIPQYPFSTFGKQINGGQPAPIFNKYLLSINKETDNDDYRKSHRKNREFTLEDRRKLCDDMIQKTHKLVKKELQEIFVRDLYKKFTENFAFKLFDQWWDKQEKEQVESKNTPIKLVEESESTRIMNVPLFNSRMENLIRDEHANEYQSVIHVPLGLGRGLRAAMPKMPSFKKKLPKLSPRREEFSDSEVESQLDEKENKRFKTPAQRRRRISMSSKDESESEESDDESVTSRSTQSTSDLSKTSRSESASSLSSSAESSDEASSDIENDKEEDENDDDDDFALNDKESIISNESSQSISVSDSHNSTSHNVSPSRSESVYSSKSDSFSQKGIVPSVDDDDEDEEEEEEVEEEGEERDRNNLSRELRNEKEDIKNKINENISKDNDIFSDIEDMNEDNNIRNGSSTDTADEAIEEIRKLEALERKQKRYKKRKIKDDRMEATEALMALANLCDESFDDYELRDSISREHNYARMPIIETPKKRGRKPKNNDEKKKDKSKLQKQIQDENRAPNLYEFGAVATEMRKAKLLNKKIEEFDDKKEITFLPRNEDEEWKICNDLIDNGMDYEDRNYLKRSYELMMQQEKDDFWWLKEVSWVEHPITVSTVSPPKQKKRKEERIHKTGCARSEGYYKVGFLEKQKYSHVANTSGPVHSIPDETITRVRQLGTTSQLSREARQNQRRLLATVDSAFTDLLKFSQLKFRKKQLKFSKSVIHDWGLFALEPIAADEMIIEYVGEKIRPLVADIREKKYEECGIGSSYLFRVDGECIVDATKCGNVARFINHSCNPNCYAKVVTVEGEKKIVIYSKQQIAVGDEITYDYKFPIEEDNKITCLCGAQGCRGYLN